MAKKQNGHFDPKLFRFLRELSLNNERAWFEENKERYHTEVRDPFLRFIADFAPRLEKIAAHAVADPRPVGGSFFRIYRDVRFAKDKTPYKTNAAAIFRHARGKDFGAPGFYLHLAPDECFVSVGMWHPEAEALKKIRSAIAAKPKVWTKLTSDAKFAGEWSLAGASLTRAPKGIPTDHPLIEDLKRTDYIAVAGLSQKEICASGFIERFGELCRTGSPFNGFIAKAIGLPW